MAAQNGGSITAFIGDVLWSQWAALGVPAAINPSGALIDPEALVIATACYTHEDHDDRIRDGAISWLVRHGEYILTTRLKRLIANIVSPDQRDQVLQLLTEAGSATKRRFAWPMLRELPKAWHASTEIASLDPWSPGLLRIRCRAIFGATAKAEAYAVLATMAGPVDLAVIGQLTGFSRRQVDDGLASLLDVNWVRRSTRGNAYRFELTDAGRVVIGAPIRLVSIGPRDVDLMRVSSAPSWIDWSERFDLLFLLAHAERRMEDGDPLTALAELRHAEHLLRELSLTVPAPLAAGESLDEAVARMEGWLPDASRRVAGVGLLP